VIVFGVGLGLTGGGTVLGITAGGGARVSGAEQALPQKVLSKKELQDVLSTLGSGAGETFNLERPRYHKVICRRVEGRPDPSSQRNPAHVVSAHIVPFSA